MRLVCDTETNGLLDQLTVIHSLLIKDLDTGQKWSLSHHPEYVSPDPEMITNISIEDGLRMIMQADLSIWHNGIGFDLLAIKKVYPWFEVDRSKVFDTMVMSMLIWTNLLDLDDKFSKSPKGKNFPPKYKGRHSLAAWGYRLGWNKIEFDGGDWQTWTPEMQIYGEGDIPVTEKLFHHIMGKNVDPRAVELEHLAKFVCARQEQYGFKFDVDAARALVAKLMVRRAELEQQLKDTFGSWKTREPDFIPKRDNKTLGYKAGVPVERYTTHVFNPGSRPHIENRLKALYGWKPKEFTPDGRAKIDETVLASLPYPEAKLLGEYLLVQMRLGQAAEGNQAWLKVEKNGRIHGRIQPGGAVTGRATHQNPNMSAIPKVGAAYGEECRSLFTASPGRVLVGCDVSGLELRMLAHFMSRYDGGLYAKIVIEGDVHWANVQALGLVPKGTKRDEKTLVIHKIFREGAKTFIYAFLYGAGGEKIGSIILDMGMVEFKNGHGQSIVDGFFDGKTAPSSKALAKVGNELKATFLEQTPALKKLIEAVQFTARKTKTLPGLDGRVLHVRSDYAALNTLLQSAGALICKRWMVEVDLEIERRGWRDLVQQVAWSHDELQFDCDPSISADLEVMLVDCIAKAGAYFNIKLPLTGEAKTGANWAETH